MREPADIPRGRSWGAALRRLLKLVVRRLLLLAGCLAAVACLLFGLLQTHPVRGWVAGRLSEQVWRATGLTLNVDAISGLFPFRFEVARVALHDADGPLLLLEGPAIDWSPLALLRGRLAVTWLGAREVRLVRRPQPGRRRNGPLALPADLPAIEVEQLDFPRLGLSAELLGKELWLAAGGSLRLDPRSDSVQVELSAQETGGGTAKFECSTLFHPAEGRLKALVRLQEQPGGVLGFVLGLSPASGLDLEVEGEGPVAGWMGRVRANVGELGSLRATAGLTEGPGPGPELELEGVLESLRWPLGRADGTVIGPIVFRLKGRRVPEGGFGLEVGRLAGEGLELAGRAWCDRAEFRYRGEAEVKVADVRGPAERGGFPEVEGRLEARALFEGVRGGSATASVEAVLDQFRASAFRTEHATASLLLSQSESRAADEGLRVSGHGRASRPLWRDAPLAPSDEAGWTLAEAPLGALRAGRGSLRLESAGVTLAVTGTEFSPNRIAAGVLELTATDLAALPALERAGLAGPARLAGAVSVDLAAKRVDGDLNGHLQRPGTAPAALVEVLGNRIDWSGRVRAVSGGRLEVADAEARCGGTTVRFTGGALPDGTGLQGDLEVRFARSDGWLRLEGPVSGSAGAPRFGARLEGKSLSLREVRLERLEGSLVLEAGREGGSGQADLKASGVSGPFGPIDSAQVKASVRHLATVPSGTAQVRLAGLVAGGGRADELTVELEGGAARCDLKLKGRGRAGAGESRRFEFDAAAVAESPGASGAWRKLTLRTLQAKVGAESLGLAAPAELRLDGGTIEAARVALTMGKARLEGSAKVAGGRVEATAELSGLPVQMLAPSGSGARGVASGTFRLEGTVAAPGAKFELRARDVRLEEGRGRLPPLQIAASGSIAGGRLEVRSTFEGVSDKPFVGEFQAPVHFSLAPPAVELPPTGALKGSVKGGLELERVARLAGLDAQRLTGRATLELRLAGSVASPAFEGGAEVRDLAYENLVTGTVLRNGQVSARARGRRLEIERGAATDGAKGKVALRGWVELDPVKGFPLALSVELEQARVASNDDIHAEAAGKVQIKGSSLAPAIEGKLSLGPADLRIPERLPQDITVIEIEEAEKASPKGPPPGAIARPAPAERTAAPGAALDLEVELPGRVFVRGRGIESEWKGRLKFGGAMDRPVVTGTLNLVRGFFTFADKRFTLVRGSIGFTGKVPPSPDLDVLAETRARGITARLGIVGTSDAPRIQLSSEPAYPADEVLSRLLFGRGLASISPAQALQLASALQALSGGGSGGGVMGFARNLVGVDLLNVGASATGAAGTAVGVGKYLQEGVYVGVEKSLGTEGSNVSVEAEIAPGLTVETNVDSNSRSAVGLNWRKEY